MASARHTSSASTARRRWSARCAPRFYLADDGLATAAYLGARARQAAAARRRARRRQDRGRQGDRRACSARRLIRLQCYEGIDAATALYEWNYPRQMLAIRQAGDQPIDIYATSS